jgi:ankyrin repeat protein
LLIKTISKNKKSTVFYFNILYKGVIAAMESLINDFLTNKTKFSIKSLKRFIESDILKSDLKKFNLLKDTFTRHERIMTTNDILKIIEKSPSDVFKIKDENQNTLLHLSINNCNKRVVLTNEILMEIAKKTPISEMSNPNKDGMLPIHLVAGMNRHHLSIPIGSSSECRELMEFIISRTPEDLRTAKDSNLRTPLHIYLEKGGTNNLELFLSISPTKIFEMQNSSGHTPLHISLIRGFSENFLSRIIKESPKSIFSMTDNLGFTPLHMAAFHGNSWNINMVLTNTPDLVLKSKNSEGKIPLDYALKKGFYTNELLIRTPDSSLSEIDKSGNNMLHKACYYKRFDIIGNIIERLSPNDFKTQNKLKSIPLQVALAGKPYISDELSNFSNWKTSDITQSIEKLIKKTQKDTFFFTDNNNNSLIFIIKDFFDTKRYAIENSIAIETAKKEKNPQIIKELSYDWINVNKRIYKLCSMDKSPNKEKFKMSDKFMHMGESIISYENDIKNKVIAIR